MYLSYFLMSEFKKFVIKVPVGYTYCFLVGMGQVSDNK